MKLIFKIICLLAMSSISCAEVYKWEDANGMHFTDNPNSIPSKYRAKAYQEASEFSPPQNVNTQNRFSNNEQVNAGQAMSQMTPSISQQLMQANQTNVDQAKIRADLIRNQQKQAAISRQVQVNALKSKQEALKSLSRYITFWIIISVVIFASWIAVIVDILRSDFKNQTNKMVWIIVVIGLGPLGMLLYFTIGGSQKVVGSTEKRHGRNNATHDIFGTR